MANSKKTQSTYFILNTTIERITFVLDGKLSVPDNTHVTVVGTVTVNSGGILKFGSNFVVLFPVHVAANECVELKNMQSFSCADHPYPKAVPMISAAQLKKEVCFAQNFIHNE